MYDSVYIYIYIYIYIPVSLDPAIPSPDFPMVPVIQGSIGSIYRGELLNHPGLWEHHLGAEMMSRAAWSDLWGLLRSDMFWVNYNDRTLGIIG